MGVFVRWRHVSGTASQCELLEKSRLSPSRLSPGSQRPLWVLTWCIKQEELFWDKMSFMPFVFLRIHLYFPPLEFPLSSCQLLLFVWPNTNSIDRLPKIVSGLPHLFPKTSYLVHLVLSLLPTVSAQSPSVAPLFFQPPPVHSPRNLCARSSTSTVQV